MQDVAQKHQLNIARRTLKLSDAGARIMGGMTKDAARRILAQAGWTAAKIERYERTV